MKVLVFGATGRIGSLVVSELSKRGHEAVVFIRRKPEKSSQEYYLGDATLADDVMYAVTKSKPGAIISCLGHIKGSPALMQKVATENILRAMSNNGINRFVSVTGTGANLPGDKLTPFSWLLDKSIELIDNPRVEDGRQFLSILKQSEVQWTVIRTSKHVNFSVGKHALTESGPPKVFVNRQEIARLMADQLDTKDWHNKAPIVSS